MISIENVILLNKPLSNFELENKAKRLKVPSFRGVFLLDTLLEKPNKKECGIVNFDKSGGPGTHWVAWYKKGRTKIYFDSYGVQQPIEVVEYLGSQIRYNTDQLQPAGQSILQSFLFVRSQRTRCGSLGVNMAGKKLSGLSIPSKSDEAATRIEWEMMSGST